MRVIVAKRRGFSERQVLDASTDEAWALSSLRLLRDRLDEAGGMSETLRETCRQAITTRNTTFVKTSAGEVPLAFHLLRRTHRLPEDFVYITLAAELTSAEMGQPVAASTVRSE